MLAVARSGLLLPGQVRPALPSQFAVPNGLVGYWSIDADSLDFTNNIASDLSGNGLSGSVVGMTAGSLRNGQIGQSLGFSGSSYIQISAQQWPQNGFSASAWINANFLAGNPEMLSVYNGGSTSPAGAYLQFLVLSTGALFGRIQQSIDTVYIQRNSNASAIAVNTLYHVVMTWNGGTTNAAIKLYSNGVQIDTTNAGAGTFTGPYSGSNIPMRIGCQFVNSAPNDGFTGTIDDVRIYNRGLDPWEVIQLYKAGLAGRRDAGNTLSPINNSMVI